MQDNFSVRNWKNKKVYKEEYNAAAGEVDDREDDELTPEELANKYAGSPMREEEEDIELEIPDDGKAPVGDKKLQSKLSKQDKIVKDYQRLKDLMQTELDMYKSFESPENKEIAKNRLKTLTPQFQSAKKEYEKLKGVKI
jgi:hypothetical protein|tara:strand:+ start:1037 stop:1456 length:420 start_codon:yes stop_codon:yes gene_type:complete